MKRVLVAFAVLSLMILTVGCSKGKVVDTQQANQQANQQRQFTQTPESSLRRAVMEIQRLQGSDKPITKEQAQKMIPIINEIKGKDTIDQAFADEKAKQIQNVFTDDQKKVLEDRQNGFKQGNGQNRQNNQNGQPNAQQSKPQSGGNNASSQPNNDQNPQRQGNGQGRGMQQGNAKDFYDQIIKKLEEIK